MAKPRNFLFVCQGNDARSQMAEGFARSMCTNGINVYSAGLKIRGLNPHAVDVMKEVGIDISGLATRTFKDIPVGKIDTVVTLSSDADEMPKLKKNKVTQIHWPLNDPAATGGNDAEVKRAYRAVRDEIKNRVQVLLVG
jgi:arsenate reductase